MSWCGIVEERHEEDASGKFGAFALHEVLEHQGPMAPGGAWHKGSKCSIKAMWEDGLMTWEPLTAMIAVDPVTSAAHAKEHGMLNVPGWKKL